MKRLLVFLLAAVMAVSTGCSKKLNKISDTSLMLDTIVTVYIYGYESEEKLHDYAGAAFSRAADLEKVMSARDEQSELSYVNAHAADQPVKISDELYALLEKALYYAELTDGAFDPTIGELIKAWGIGTDHERVPSEAELAALSGLRNYKNVILDPAEKTVYFSVPGFSVDLGAIAKGYIGDEMKKTLTDLGVTSALLNLGGNIVTIGENADKDSDWAIGIGDPDEPTSEIAVIHITDKTVVTSGGYQRYFEKDGQIYHHILDPFTGMPADCGLLSTSIITSVSADADALSTAAYVMGHDRALELIESLDGFDIIFIDSSKTISGTYPFSE